MKTLRKQRTIARPAEVTGFGYWSGKNVRVEFRPAAPGSGIVFVRSDLDPPRRIPVAVEHRIEVPRRTALAADGSQVEMVEHILAALYGLSIDNCEIWVDGPEMPGCDGSAQPFVAALDAVGVVEQPASRRRLVVMDITRVGDEDCWIEARHFPVADSRSSTSSTTARTTPSASSPLKLLSPLPAFVRSWPRPAPSFSRKKPIGSASAGLASG